MGEYKPAHRTGGEGASCENEKKGAFAGAVFGDVLCYTLFLFLLGLGMAWFISEPQLNRRIIQPSNWLVTLASKSPQNRIIGKPKPTRLVSPK